MVMTVMTIMVFIEVFIEPEGWCQISCLYPPCPTMVCSVMSSSLGPHELEATGLHCP